MRCSVSKYFGPLYTSEALGVWKLPYVFADEPSAGVRLFAVAANLPYAIRVLY